MKRSSQYQARAVALLFALCGSTAAVQAQGAKGGFDSEAPKDAQQFVDSIGVNTHINYFDRLYGNFPLLKSQLEASGIRHVRDGAVLQNDAYNRTVYGRWKELAAFGVRFDMCFDPRGSIKTPTPDEISKLLALAGGSVDSIEGPNELDNSKKPAWIDLVHNYQQSLFEAGKRVPEAQSIAFIGPSMAFVKNAQRVGDVSSYITYGNLHPYPAGGMPSGVFPKQIQQAEAMYGKKPIVITETGYHNAVNDQRSQPSISEEAGAKYIPRLFFEDYNNGIVRTYLYEFFDEGDDPNQNQHEFHWGLVRHDGSQKPAFTALKNVITVLRDTGGDGGADDSASGKGPRGKGAQGRGARGRGDQGRGAPGRGEPVRFRIDGDTSSLHHTFLKKRSGAEYLALWQEVPSYDTKQLKDIAVAPRKVTIAFSSPVRQVNLYDSMKSANAAQHWSGSSQVPLDVPDHVVILELLP